MDENNEKSGDILVGGDVGPGAAIGHKATVHAQNIAGGDIQISPDMRVLKDAFFNIYKKIDEKSFESPDEKQEVKDAVEAIEMQNTKGEQASQSILKIKLETLAMMAPDIFDVVVATLTSPLVGISTVARKIAEKARADSEKHE